MDCRFEVPSVANLPDNELTVGREFILVCQGEWPRQPLDNAHFVLAPENKYLIKLLRAEFRNTAEVDLHVTSYTAGDIKFENLQFAIGDKQVDLGPIQYQVKSVLPQDPQQKVEPFGPLGPVVLSWPQWMWMALVPVIVLLVGVLTIQIRRWWQRKNLIEELSVHDSSQTPLHQLHSLLRKFSKDYDIYEGSTLSHEKLCESLRELKKIYLLFITRQFVIPAEKWPMSLVIKKVLKTQYFEKSIRKEFERVTLEFDKLIASEKLEVADVVKTIRSIRNVSEKIAVVKSLPNKELQS